MGLPADAVRALSRMALTGATPAELEAATGLPRDAVAAALGALQERRLVTEAGKAGQARVFVPLLSRRLPSVSGLRGDWELPLGPAAGPAREVRVTEGQVREVLKGLEPTAEVVAFEVFSYPLYEVVYAGGGRERRLFLDAVTGKWVKGLSP